MVSVDIPATRVSLLECGSFENFVKDVFNEYELNARIQ